MRSTCLSAMEPRNSRTVRRPSRPSFPRRCGRRVISARASLRSSAAAFPLTGVVGDQQAALFGQACFGPGMRRTRTAPALRLVNVASRPPSRQSRPAEDGRVGDRRGGNVRTRGERVRRGAAVQWLRDGLGSSSWPGKSNARGVVDANDGVYFVPALSGLGSPYWDPEARGGGSWAYHARHDGRRISRARRLRRSPTKPSSTPSGRWRHAVQDLHRPGPARGRRGRGRRTDGCSTQFQADALGVPVIVPEVTETTGYGAAYLAGIAVGTWDRQTVGDVAAAGRLRAANVGGPSRGAALALTMPSPARGSGRPRAHRLLSP